MAGGYNGLRGECTYDGTVKSAAALEGLGVDPASCKVEKPAHHAAPAVHAPAKKPAITRHQADHMGP